MIKVFIPNKIHEAIHDAPDGSVVSGTYSSEYQVATVTELRHGCDAASRIISHSVCHNHANPISSNITRQTLAIIGNNNGNLPLHIKREGNIVWSDCNGNPVEVEIYESDDFFKRTPFDTEVMNFLHSERVLIIGTGSVGAPMGLELAKSGIGQLIMVDKDVLEIHNCMRHALGAAYVGWPKPVAFKHYVEEHVQTCKCIPVYGDIFQGDRRRLRNIIEETRPTRILASADSLRIQYLCQRAALFYQIPLMAVWCDNNAIEGEIFMWEPGQARAWRPGRPKRGCYACMRNPAEITITRSSSFDYSSDDPDSYGGEPALGTFINRINNIATIIMIAWMLRKCPVQTKLAGILDEYYEGKGLQYIRLGGPYPYEAEGRITSKTPWAVEWYRVLKRDDCPFCADSKRNEEILFPEVDDNTKSHDNWDNFEEVSPK